MSGNNSSKSNINYKDNKKNKTNDDMNRIGKNMSLKQRLLNGGKSYGIFCLSDSPVVAELMAGLDYDHIIVDHEHGTTDVRSGLSMLQAISAGNLSKFMRNNSVATYNYTEPIVRVSSPNNPVEMKKVLDTLKLPGGILVPMIDDAEMAKQVVRSVRYPNQHSNPTGRNDAANHDNDGIRGCCVPAVRASGWGISQNKEEYLSQCKDDLLLIVQVETLKGVQNIKEIAAVDGVDMIFLGPMDLSCSIGQMGNFGNNHVQELIQTAENAVIQSNCLLAGALHPGRTLHEMFHKSNYCFICGSADVMLLREAAKNDVQSGTQARGGYKSKDEKNKSNNDDTNESPKKKLRIGYE